jgi:TDG/mug DNA glycosylase family protein
MANELLPAALARRHFSTAVDDEVTFSRPEDMPHDRFALVVHGAGFEIVSEDRSGVVARRARTLPDTVGPDLRLILIGLNPSLRAADAGFGFAGPNNRFWPAALEAGVVTVANDPLAVMERDGVGMTDLVKRASRRASEVGPAEFRDGIDRIAVMADWLRPAALCFVGLGGFRAAVDRTAVAGPQPERVGGVAAYVMPNPSGLNTHIDRDGLVAHFRAALDLADHP